MRATGRPVGPRLAGDRRRLGGLCWACNAEQALFSARRLGPPSGLPTIIGPEAYFRLTMATRRLGRPRTKVYDLNYNLGESYYRNALEGLDRKYGKAPAETIEAPKRPMSVGDLESILVSDRRPPSQSKVISDALEEDQEMMETLKRIQRARKTNFSAEAEFENSFFNRQEEASCYFINNKTRKCHYY
ncbi:hypothetical protein GE061_005455 [Apolygus lucorum]|uniref:Uncharacterized protein n=1 Tax=Apolygus lucorum TaxID=248454 RepID=A0A8S9WY26_APOLU|nr:hypothetical protein GE061_005455 [Apolygus lucorum]